MTSTHIQYGHEICMSFTSCPSPGPSTNDKVHSMSRVYGGKGEKEEEDAEEEEEGEENVQEGERERSFCNTNIAMSL